MLKLAIFGVILLTLLLQLQVDGRPKKREFYADNDDNFCDGKANGNYPYRSNCNGFISCSNGAVYHMSCPARLKWNDHKKYCDWPQNAYPSCPGDPCGYRFVTDEKEGRWAYTWMAPEKRVVGGKESIPGSWPWQVALFFNGTQGCAGSLINRNWIVTAAHCFHDSYSSTNPKHWSATLGEHKLKEKEEFEQVRSIESITLHPKYNFPYFKGIYDTPPDYDVAIIKLASPAKLTRVVHPICLLAKSQIFKPGKKCYLTGWGKTKFNGQQPPALNEAEVKIVSMKSCNKALSYAGKIHDRAICAGYEKGGVDACQFDSGGPLSCEKDGQYFLTGVVSWGHECARPHKYGVYSNMAVLTPWVMKTIEDKENQGKQDDNHHYGYTY